MKLHSDSLAWAVRHLTSLGDSDLFPKPIEIDIIAALGHDAIDCLSDVELSSLRYGPSRRFIIPKGELSYRVATQLDPLDSIFLAAIVRQFGEYFEARRRPLAEKVVFSYRYSPDPDGQLYDPSYSWNEFWSHCYGLAGKYNYAVVLDVADFYNQIYHHVLENQITEAGIPNQVKNWVVGLLGHVTAMVSRGIPVGPHSSHLLAEVALAPVDNSLIMKGITFCRYVDDIVLFCDSLKEAHTLIFETAAVLDRQQRLILQNQKTRILASHTFREYCKTMSEDRPINDLESNLLSIIQKYSKGDPYRIVHLSELSDEDLKQFGKETVAKILDEYLDKDQPNYARLRWFMRRLAQIGHPSGVKYCIEHLNRLLPAIGEVCRYFVSVSDYENSWDDTGSALLQMINDPLVRSNEYLQLSIYSLFNRKVELDHFKSLVTTYGSLSPCLKREVILAAHAVHAGDWLRELKEHLNAMDVWNRRAFLVACANLRKEERRFFLRQVDTSNPLDRLIVKWAREQ
ncbi:MAG: Retron-type reverse transcriptase [Firmicutes bacterium]|nr:Retron-type reverse transcriptase [Bacillota bacterium]